MNLGTSSHVLYFVGKHSHNAMPASQVCEFDWGEGVGIISSLILEARMYIYGWHKVLVRQHLFI